ncbi:MAG: hypothetical protein ABJZ55_19225 [Fuerstiella sp.]
MKITQTIPAVMLGLAATVTAGSVYVTVQAAAQQESSAIPLPTIVEDAPAAIEMVASANNLPAEDVLNSRGHFLAIDASGTLNGRLSALTESGTTAASGLTVKVIKDGVEIVRTTTSEDGSFTATGLSDGTVAMLAYNDEHFLLYAVNLRRVEQAGPLAIQELGMNSAVVSNQNATLARQLVYGSVQNQEWRFQESASDTDREYPEGDTMTPSTAVAHHRVQLGADGSLTGQVNLLDPRTGLHRSIQDLTVHFLKNGSVVGSTEVSPNGEFRMDGLQPGVHGLVSTGQDGVLAIGIDLVGASFAANEDSRYKLTSVAQTLDLAVAPVTYRNFQPQFVEDNTPIQSEGFVDVGPLAAPFGPGGFGGGAGGIGSGGGAGGGLGGGGGGLGALLGAAAGAGLGFALGDDDDGPSSPAR